MIPTPLLISLAAQRENVPFPALVEALMMEVTFEILREAGVRMPRAIGQAVSIVGALVLGQAAVQAGIVSSAMVIVVSITGIASFATPAFNMSISIRLLRFVIMIAAATFGFLRDCNQQHNHHCPYVQLAFFRGSLYVSSWPVHCGGPEGCSAAFALMVTPYQTPVDRLK